MYPITSKENSRRIRIEIRRVFMDVWDPIGVRDEPNAWNEYDSYLGGALELLMAGASDAEWNEYLDGVVAGMGTDSSRHSQSDVIQALREIDLKEVSGTFGAQSS
jgi:hypothetical protein